MLTLLVTSFVGLASGTRVVLARQIGAKDEDNIRKIANWIKGANKYFLQKFKAGDNCLDADGLSPVDNQTTLEFLEILRKDIPNTQTRGYDF